MRKPVQILAALMLLVALVAGAYGLLQDSRPEQAWGITPPLLIKSDHAEQFARATGPMAFQFPLDHGPHPEYQTEWWYYTGNLEATDGSRYGYQLTFFRRAIEPPNIIPQRDSDWATEQLYLAHFALTDVNKNRFYSEERISRGALDLAGATTERFHVWLENWEVRATSGQRYRLTAEQEGVRLALQLTETKGPVLQGNAGYSPKGPEIGNASHYYNLPRLQTTGTIAFSDRAIDVEGLSWMDHEFSTSALGPNQVGWDWFSIQLDNETELMFFQLRRDDGSIDPFSSGTIIAADGNTTHLTAREFDIEVHDIWESLHSGAEYPAGWHISVPSREIELDVEPLVADQELNHSFVYWEGAVEISGTDSNNPVSGYGYVELTGYAHSMQGQF